MQPAAAEEPILVPGAPVKPKNRQAVDEAGKKTVPGALRNVKKKMQKQANALMSHKKRNLLHLNKNQQKVVEAAKIRTGCTK
jgi:hypothetical protein